MCSFLNYGYACAYLIEADSELLFGRFSLKFYNYGNVTRQCMPETYYLDVFHAWLFYVRFSDKIP